ncbi:MAG: sialidase family protein, partial [Bacteroidota bacterium]
MGSNKVHRSLDQGETFEALSGDLTRGGRPGDVPYGTLTSLDESPLKFGLLYAGSDDGLVHVSRDAGTTWTRISDSFPSRYADWWVSRVEASHHEAGRVYVALNGYRFDDFEAVLFRSDDYGETWTRIGTNVPAEPVNVVLEDSRNEDLLYVGTDHGLYASIDGGSSFHALGDLPATPVHDLVVQEREQDLVVGTHGRSIYVGDIAPIRAMTDTLTSQPVYVFGIDAIDHSGRWGNSSRMWTEPSEPSRTITVWSATAGSATLRVHGVDDEVLHEMSFDAQAGLNTLTYDLSAGASDETDTGKAYLDAGTYRVAVTRAGDAAETALVVE